MYVRQRCELMKHNTEFHTERKRVSHPKCFRLVSVGVKLNMTPEMTVEDAANGGWIFSLTDIKSRFLIGRSQLGFFFFLLLLTC